MGHKVRRPSLIFNLSFEIRKFGRATYLLWRVFPLSALDGEREVEVFVVLDLDFDLDFDLDCLDLDFDLDFERFLSAEGDLDRDPDLLRLLDLRSPERDRRRLSYDLERDLRLNLSRERLLQNKTCEEEIRNR